MRYRKSIGIGLIVLPALLVHASKLAAENEATRYVRFQLGNLVAYGIIEGDSVRQIAGDVFGTWKPTAAAYKLSQVKLLVPTQPSKVLAAAGNYKSHLGDKPVPKQPELFFKVPSCLIAQGEAIVIPEGTDRVDAEGELVIVIRKRAKNVPVSQALDHVLGVTCGNDVSARDWQANDVQWWRAKGTDTFGPCGPVVASGINYDDLLLELRVNGEVRQKQRTGDMIHSVAELVSWASRHVTLQPGDLIYTGTPGKTPQLQPGDVVEVELEAVGVLRNPVKAASQ